MMNKLFFRNDYGEGAHPLVMERLRQRKSMRMW